MSLFSPHVRGPLDLRVFNSNALLTMNTQLLIKYEELLPSTPKKIISSHTKKPNEVKIENLR